MTEAKNGRRQQLANSIERRSGVSLWRQIADQILHSISMGDFAENAALPPGTLARRYGVNLPYCAQRHSSTRTGRRAQGRAGRGTFVLSRKRLSYPTSRPHTLFDRPARASVRAPQHPARVGGRSGQPARRRGLGLAKGSTVIRWRHAARPTGSRSRATGWFDARRFAGIESAMTETGSVTASLERFGISDYLRQSTVLSARHADAADLSDLDLQPGAIVLVAVAVNVTPDRDQFAETVSRRNASSSNCRRCRECRPYTSAAWRLKTAFPLRLGFAGFLPSGGREPAGGGRGGV
jgi:GntR family phosphonate transport system transcriptional regulator